MTLAIVAWLRPLLLTWLAALVREMVASRGPVARRARGRATRGPRARRPVHA